MYFEDYVPGVRTHHPRTVTIDQAALIEFAEQFDPQYIHIDPAAAADGPFKGLIASGWHTASLMMRLYADQYLRKVGSLGGPGIDKLRWLAPVRPDDELRLRTEVMEARLSRSKPDRGLVRTRAELFNQDDVRVFSCEVLTFVGIRPS
ncbi:MaoC family dehydratase [Kribbella solani]|uniref:MaoC family dehydratase n=1 Tax=Kribbella solani TaxID=236067 RepID=UPI0029AF95C8|nr:MaoC family dehydratase [Kribbella solani]MDX2973914.1 MaoC family dehydratase [Kribbella solani]MDX3006870.1 MaoC family dehydratase [Kribbella solani]